MFKKKDNGSKIHVIIKHQTGTTFNTVAEFDCWKKKDSDGVLKIINEKYRFKERIEWTKDATLEILETQLDFSNMTREEKIDRLKTKIEKQKTLIANIKNGVVSFEKSGKKEKKRVNIWDEKNKLNTYEVLLDSVKNNDSEDVSSYYGTRIDNTPEIILLSKDGLLYPLRHNPLLRNLNPDNSVKQQITTKDQQMLDLEAKDSLKGLLGGVFYKILAIGIVVLFIVNVFAFISLINANKEYVDNYETSLQKNVGDLVQKLNINNALTNKVLQNNNITTTDDKIEKKSNLGVQIIETVQDNT